MKDKKQHQLKLRSERKEFKDNLKIYCRINRVTQREICAGIGICEQEFHNLLTGYQSSVPNKGIDSFSEFQQKIFSYLCITQL